MGYRFEWLDVTVEGDDGPIISNFTARVPTDGLTLLVGPSGAGKTTLLRLLNRLDDPDGGVVLLDGRDLREYDVLDLRRRVQGVSQVPVTFPGTVAENVLLGTKDPPAAEGLAAVEGLLERVGLASALAGREADRLSVGEAQRMALARALARRPDVLLLDEPTSALDAGSKGGIERLIRRLADEGLTVVMVTHDPAHQALADTVIEVGSA